MSLDFLFDTASPYYFLSLFVVGLVSGFIGAMGGSSGLIIMPFMIGSGVPPALALGTARLAAIPAWIIAVKKFNKAGHVRWDVFPLITVLAVIAGMIGTRLLIGIDEKCVYPVVAVLLLLFAPLSFLKKDFGLKSVVKNKNSRIFGYFLYFLIMIYAGFFGAGAAPMIMFAFVTFIGFRSFEAYATELTAWVVMSFFSSAIFIYYGQVNYIFAVDIFVSMSLGSYIGSHYAVKGGDKWVRGVVSVFAFIVGIKLLIWG